MMRTGKVILLLIVVLLRIECIAQDFDWKAKLDAVPQNGFYRIPLSLDWLWRVKNDLSDVRLQAEGGAMVPFLVQQKAIERGTSFIDFPMLRNTTDTAITTLEVDASKHIGTDRIDIVMGNTAVERRASLSGSNDQQQWFIVDEALWLQNAIGNANDRFVQTLRFPFVRYRYLKFQINNRGTDPLPIVTAGVFVDTTTKLSPEMHVDSGTTYRQVDSANGYSYAWIHNPFPYPVTKISLQASGAKFYQREVEFFTVKNGKPIESLLTTMFRSGEEATFLLPATKAQDLLVTIKNGDNPPLQLTSVRTFTQPQNLIAYLEKGKRYALVGGNANVAFPQYDLTNFRDSIPATLATLNHGEIYQNSSPQVATTKVKRWWIWPVILLMLAMLTIVTVRMAKEAKA